MFREIDYFPVEYICRVLIDNGTILSVLPDGTADGNDGLRYQVISHPSESGDLIIDGWKIIEETEH